MLRNQGLTDSKVKDSPPETRFERSRMQGLLSMVYVFKILNRAKCPKFTAYRSSKVDRFVSLLECLDVFYLNRIR